MVDEGEPITLQEALEEYEELEKQSTAVLGASDPGNCSYPQGYMKRQALYSCLTCNPKNSPEFQPAGVCLGCSYKCHDGHELIELYTKRNFRCDCGNKRFSGNPCQLFKDKEEENLKNMYNQNFRGEYCTCHRPYPDPEASDEDTMIQCVICEDWLHSQHTIPGMKISEYEQFEDGLELICGACLPKVSFMGSYGSLMAKPVKVEETGQEGEKQQCTETNSEIATAVPTCEKTEQVIPHSGLEGTGENEDAKRMPLNQITQAAEAEGKVVTNGKTELSHSPEIDKLVPNPDECVVQKTSEKFEISDGVGCLLKDGWREKLCRCSDCKVTYESAKVSFLIDEEDTIDCYEAVGKEKEEIARMKAEESFNKQINELGHVGQIELISGYNDLTQALKEFLQGFSATGRVVEKRDIDEFFNSFQAAKRRRLNP